MSDDYTEGSDYLPDDQRRQRTGLVEAVFCETKSDEQIATILRHSEQNGQHQLLTRLLPEQYAALPANLRSQLDYERVSRTGWFGQPTTVNGPARVAVVTGGTSDAPAAREAIRTLHWHGFAAAEIFDVGVAGLWRLTDRIDFIATHPDLIRPPSTVGIAVPTSTGYGAADQGRTAMHALLASCAPGITVVNIDNGYGAACAAMRILNLSATVTD